MTSTTNKLDIQQMELCAVSVMRTMLEDYSIENGIAFEEAFLRFVESSTYQMLFDYSTGLWREGPDYLRAMFEEVVNEIVS